MTRGHLRRRARLVVLASGEGSNAQAIIDASKAPLRGDALAADVVAVVTDRPAAPVLRRARNAGVVAVALPPESGESRSAYDDRLVDLVRSFDPDVVVLAGWMRILSAAFVREVEVAVMNLHPALPGEFPGTRAIERAYAGRGNGRSSSGVMVHLVVDEGVDDGPVLATTTVALHPADTLEQFAERMHCAEHRLLVDTIRTFISTAAAQPRRRSITERASR